MTTSGTDTHGRWTLIDGGAVAHWWLDDAAGTACGRKPRYETRRDPNGQRCIDCLHRLRFPAPATPGTSEPPQARVPFMEAYRQIWIAKPNGTVRNTWAAFGCLFMLGIQVAMIVAADNLWGLLGVVCLPVAAWFVLRGWVYQRQSWRGLGLLLFILGAMVPFYLM